jgi:hypothetical protein
MGTNHNEGTNVTDRSDTPAVWLQDDIPDISVVELSAEECDVLDLDETLRESGGFPYVRVTISTSSIGEHSYVGRLTEARISPEHIQEV